MTFPLTSPEQWDSVWAARHTNTSSTSSSGGWYWEMIFSEKKMKSDFFSLCVCSTEGPGRPQRPRGAARSIWRSRSGRHRCESQIHLSYKRDCSDSGQSCRSVQWSCSSLFLHKKEKKQQWRHIKIKTSSRDFILTTLTCDDSPKRLLCTLSREKILWLLEVSVFNSTFFPKPYSVNLNMYHV